VIAALMLVCVFLILTSYYVMKTAREGLILAGGTWGLRGDELKTYATGAMALLLIGIVPAYGALASRVRRMRLITISYTIVIASLLGFYVLGQAGVHVGLAFFIWLGLVSVFLIAQFWSYANDIYTEEAGKRLFAIIALGGSFGAMLGPRIAKLAETFTLMLVAGVILAACIVLFHVIERVHARHPEADGGAPVPIPGAGGFALVVRDRYLLLIGAMLLVLNLVNTTGEYILSNAAREHAMQLVPATAHADLAGAARDAAIGADRREVIKAFYGDFFSWVNLVGFLVQAFVVSRVIDKLGIRRALFVMPVIAFIGYGAIGLVGGLALIRIVKIAENATDYSLQNTVRQALFLPTSRGVKYKAKAAIDTFFVRAGDTMSALLIGVGIHQLGLDARQLAFANLGLIAVWLVIAVGIARRHRELGVVAEAAHAAPVVPRVASPAGGSVVPRAAAPAIVAAALLVLVPGRAAAQEPPTPAAPPPTAPAPAEQPAPTEAPPTEVPPTAPPPAEAPPIEVPSAEAPATAAPAPAAPPTDEPTAADVAGAPRPGEESGRLDEIDPGDSTGRKLARGVLFVPRAALEIVFAPVRGLVWAFDRYDLMERYYDIFFNDARTFGVTPIVRAQTGFGVTLGAKLVHRDLFGEGERLTLAGASGGQYDSLIDGALRSGRRFGRLYLDVGGELDRRSKERFYGIGNGDEVDAAAMPIDPLTDPTAVETRYEQQLIRATAGADLELVGDLHARAAASIADVELGRSEQGMPIDEVYMPASLVGFEGYQLAYGELEVRWDSRRAASYLEPTRIMSSGVFAAAFLGRTHAFDGFEGYWRYGGDLQGFWRIAPGPRVLAGRLRAEGVTGQRDEVPLNELPQLGGRTYLRGYPTERFRDRLAVVGSVDYEWDLARFFTAGLFVDAGRVYEAPDELTLDDLRVGYGVSLQIHTGHMYLMRFNVATSIDGGVFFDFAFDSLFTIGRRTERH